MYVYMCVCVYVRMCMSVYICVWAQAVGVPEWVYKVVLVGFKPSQLQINKATEPLYDHGRSYFIWLLMGS